MHTNIHLKRTFIGTVKAFSLCATFDFTSLAFGLRRNPGYETVGVIVVLRHFRLKLLY